VDVGNPRADRDSRRLLSSYAPTPLPVTTSQQRGAIYWLTCGALFIRQRPGYVDFLIPSNTCGEGRNAPLKRSNRGSAIFGALAPLAHWRGYRATEFDSGVRTVHWVGSARLVPPGEWVRVAAQRLPRQADRRQEPSAPTHTRPSQC